MQLEFLEANGFETAVYEWGNPSGPAVLCVHGLGGQGQSFRKIADHLASEFRIVALDLIGRGQSVWANSPQTDYNFATYSQIITDILAHKRIDTFHWIGISMGGALGIHLGSGRLQARIKSLTLNDIGPSLENEVAMAIQTAVSTPTRVARFSDLVAAYESMFATFGMKPSDGRSWQDMALDGARRTDDGGWTLHFDPRVADQFTYARADYEQVASLRKLDFPMQVFWGTESAVLTREGLEAMRQAQPELAIIEVANVGHAPLLDRDEDLDAILHFLRRSEHLAQTGGKA